MFEFAYMPPEKIEHVRCAGPLRYRRETGLYEQLWLIEEYIGGSKSGQREEWRPVPTV